MSTLPFDFLDQLKPRSCVALCIMPPGVVRVLNATRDGYDSIPLPESHDSVRFADGPARISVPWDDTTIWRIVINEKRYDIAADSQEISKFVDYLKTGAAAEG